MSTSPGDEGKKNVRGPHRMTRNHWIDAAVEVMMKDGIDAVKIAPLSEHLDCARSSFYWFFENRQDLLDAIVDHWLERNTNAIVNRANTNAETINDAVIDVFECWANTKLFDPQLDFAIREWARKDKSILRFVDMSDNSRLSALTSMFERFGFVQEEADVRARLIYFAQIGYDSLSNRRNRLDRRKTGPYYVFCHTGQPVTEQQVARLNQLLTQADPAQGNHE